MLSKVFPANRFALKTQVVLVLSEVVESLYYYYLRMRTSATHNAALIVFFSFHLSAPERRCRRYKQGRGHRRDEPGSHGAERKNACRTGEGGVDGGAEHPFAGVGAERIGEEKEGPVLSFGGVCAPCRSFPLLPVSLAVVVEAVRLIYLCSQLGALGTVLVLVSGLTGRGCKQHRRAWLFASLGPD